jgi:hypothetical protein
MFRQRLRGRVSRLGVLGEIVVVVAALACLWYGLMVVLLSVKVSPGSVETISGYRAIFDYLASLQPDDVDGRFRLIAGLSGLAVFLVCITLAWLALPRPYLARSELELTETREGTLTVEPRTIERAVEIRAKQHVSVTAAAARYGSDELTVNIDAHRAQGSNDALAEVQQTAHETLHQHGLPDMPVSVTLAGFHRKTRRELN